MTAGRIEKARAAAEAALARRAENLSLLDVREVASFADTFLIVSGRSDRQVRAIADAIRDALAALGERPLGIEGYEEGRWVLIDFGDLVAHVFVPELREYYDLDRLWGDAPDLAAELELAEPPPDTGTGAVR